MRHHTIDKGTVKVDISNAVMQGMTEMIQKTFSKNKDHYMIEEEEKNKKEENEEEAGWS